MKSFEELNKQIALARYIGSEFGTMYFIQNVPREKEAIVRHLDGKLTIELLPLYIQLYDSIKKWIDKTPKLQEYVFMPDFLEIGKDYIIRPFFAYYIATSEYNDEEEPIEPPAQYEEMKALASKELDGSSGNEEIIRRVLRKSLLKPTGKTYFDYKMKKFIIVEPKISLEDLAEWKQENP